MYAVQQILASPKPLDFCEAGLVQHYIIYAVDSWGRQPVVYVSGSTVKAPDRRQGKLLLVGSEGLGRLSECF